MRYLLSTARAISEETPEFRQYSYFGPDGTPLHTCRIEQKKKPLIQVFPYGYSERNGITRKKISEIEFRGWSSYDSLPKILKPGNHVTLAHKGIKPLMWLLYARYPKLKKLIVTQESGRTRFSDTAATFSFADLERIGKAITREATTYEVRRNTAALNALAEASSQFKPRRTKLTKGGGRSLFILL
jgi:hypothetical protein